MCNSTFLDRYNAVVAAHAAVSTLQDLIAAMRGKGLDTQAIAFIEREYLPPIEDRLDTADQRFIAGVDPAIVVSELAVPSTRRQ